MNNLSTLLVVADDYDAMKSAMNCQTPQEPPTGDLKLGKFKSANIGLTYICACSDLKIVVVYKEGGGEWRWRCRGSTSVFTITQPC